MSEYPFETIWVNDREVYLAQIISGNAQAETPNEVSAFSFIRKWFSDENEFLIQTSGSTGPSKTIFITRHQMEMSAANTERALSLKRLANALVCLDTKYIAGQMMLVRCFHTGMRINILDPSSNPFSKKKFPAIDFVALVPYQLSSILNSKNTDQLNNLGAVIIGGAAVNPETIHALQKFNSRFYATYGMTETISHIALQSLNGPDKSDYFEVLPGVQISKDARNCLIIDVRYLDQPLVTNDIVRIVGPTSFQWVGRFDNVINTGGVKVSPESIEHIVNSLKPSLNLHEQFVISSVADPSLGERIVGVIETEALDNEAKSRILVYLKENLEKYHWPSDIFCIRPFPQTASGKIDRMALRKMITERL